MPCAVLIGNVPSIFTHSDITAIAQRFGSVVGCYSLSQIIAAKVEIDVHQSPELLRSLTEVNNLVGNCSVVCLLPWLVMFETEEGSEDFEAHVFESSTFTTVGSLLDSDNQQNPWGRRGLPLATRQRLPDSAHPRNFSLTCVVTGPDSGATNGFLQKENCDVLDTLRTFLNMVESSIIHFGVVEAPCVGAADRDRSPSPPRWKDENLSYKKVGNFSLLSQIGKGNNARVFTAIHESCELTAAVKVMDAASVHVVREIQCLRLINEEPRDAYSVIVHEVAAGPPCSRGETIGVALELLGVDVMQLSSRMHLTEMEILALGLEMLNTLRALHKKKVVHKSVKPQNFCFFDPPVRSYSINSRSTDKNCEDYLNRSGNVSICCGPLVKLIDYGRAQIASNDNDDNQHCFEDPFTGWWYSITGLLGAPQGPIDDVVSVVHCIGFLLEDRGSQKNEYLASRKLFVRIIEQTFNRVRKHYQKCLNLLPLPVPLLPEHAIACTVLSMLPPDTFFPTTLPVWWRHCYGLCMNFLGMMTPLTDPFILASQLENELRTELLTELHRHNQNRMFTDKSMQAVTLNDLNSSLRKLSRRCSAKLRLGRESTGEADSDV